MKYETAAQMAQRLGINVRTVQIWAKEGKLAGAVKQGRDWLIPAGTGKPGRSESDVRTQYMPLPLINSVFEPGTMLSYAESMESRDLRDLAMAEYFYFTGRHKEAAEQTEVFFNHPDITIKLSACLIYTFSNLALGHIHFARMGLGCIEESLEVEVTDKASMQVKATCVFISATARVLLHLDPPKVNLADYIRYLPQGLQIWAYCIRSHAAYLRQEYNLAMGIIETVLSMHNEVYPISMVYMHLFASMNLMALKRIDEAREHFAIAWDIAKKDDIIEPFGELHGLLYGLIETCLRDAEPEAYSRIIRITYSFSDGWRQIHNTDMNNQVADNLTTTEFAISMLANKNWSNLEIADYMHMSVHTVKRYVSIIYQKLGITNRNELKSFMLK